LSETRHGAGASPEGALGCSGSLPAPWH